MEKMSGGIFSTFIARRDCPWLIMAGWKNPLLLFTYQKWKKKKPKEGEWSHYAFKNIIRGKFFWISSVWQSVREAIKAVNRARAQISRRVSHAHPSDQRPINVGWAQSCKRWSWPGQATPSPIQIRPDFGYPIRPLGLIPDPISLNDS